MGIGGLTSLIGLFNNRIFRIPDYQRGYAWGKHELEEFWDDLRNLNLGKMDYHYTGLLTLEEITREEVKGLERWKDDLWIFDRGFHACYIVDGQQRLVTLLILIRVILDRFADGQTINFYHKDDLRKRFFYEQIGVYQTDILGYEKNSSSYPYFKRHIVGCDVPSLSDDAPTDLYTENLKAARAFFQEKTENFTPEKLEVLLRKLMNSLKFHVYDIEDEMEVFLRFETINNRGKQLTILELLKNRLIYLTSLLPEEEYKKNELRHRINGVWKTIFELMGKNKDHPLNGEEFLLNHWIMYFNSSHEKPVSYSQFLLNRYFIAKNVLEEGGLVKIGYGQIRNYIESILRGIQTWFAMHHPLLSNLGPEMKESLVRMVRIGYGFYKPLILATMVKETDENQLVGLLNAMYRFELTMERLCIRRSKVLEARFFLIANRFYRQNGGLNLEEMKEYIEKMRDSEILGMYHLPAKVEGGPMPAFI